MGKLRRRLNILIANRNDEFFLRSIRRMFRWPRILTRTATVDVEPRVGDDVPVDSVAVAIPNPAMSSSNNILNSNLSNSFRDSDDDEQLMERNIYEPIQSSTDAIVPSTSTSHAQQEPTQRLGVAAIPNTQFCPTTPLSSRTNRRRPNDDFNV